MHDHCAVPVCHVDSGPARDLVAKDTRGRILQEENISFIDTYSTATCQFPLASSYTLLVTLFLFVMLTQGWLWARILVISTRTQSNNPSITNPIIWHYIVCLVCLFNVYTYILRDYFLFAVLYIYIYIFLFLLLLLFYLLLY